MSVKVVLAGHPTPLARNCGSHEKYESEASEYSSQQASYHESNFVCDISPPLIPFPAKWSTDDFVVISDGI